MFLKFLNDHFGLTEFTLHFKQEPNKNTSEVAHHFPQFFSKNPTKSFVIALLSRLPPRCVKFAEQRHYNDKITMES